MDNLPLLPNIPWSWSLIHSFETCPMECYLTRVAKTHGQQKGKQAWDGDDTHLAMQAYIEKGKEPPIGLRKLKGIAIAVTGNAIDVVTEAKIGLRNDMSVCGYFDKDVNARIIIDLLAVHRDKAYVVDWKTGQPRDTPDQLRICSWLVFSRYPNVQRVNAMFVYTKFPDKKYRFDRADWANSINQILPRIERFKQAHDTKAFPPTPCFKCEKYCAVLECSFNGKKQQRNTHDY